MPPAEESSSWFLEVEAHFAERRGTPFIFSAKDWALMKSWHDDGIPLSVVIEAIDRCFDKRGESKRRGTISSLTYCRHAVAALWDERKELRVGGSATLPESDPASQLEGLAALLDQCAAGQSADSLRSAVSAAAASVRAIRGADAVPQIEEKLMAVEESLVEQLLAQLPEEDARAIDAEIDASLASFGKLDEATRRRTREANRKRLVRARLALPRLTLFS